MQSNIYIYHSFRSPAEFMSKFLVYEIFHLTRRDETNAMSDNLKQMDDLTNFAIVNAETEDIHTLFTKYGYEAFL